MISFWLGVLFAMIISVIKEMYTRPIKKQIEELRWDIREVQRAQTKGSH